MLRKSLLNQPVLAVDGGVGHNFWGRLNPPSFSSEFQEAILAGLDRVLRPLSLIGDFFGEIEGHFLVSVAVNLLLPVKAKILRFVVLVAAQ